MKLKDLDFMRLLPQFMHGDGAVKGLAKGLNTVIPELYKRTRLLSTWDHIDELPESELDALAWELNILWYDSGASADIKRELVKNSDLVYRRLGTKWAVENVIRSYFQQGYVQEWYEYNGKPGTFRVCATVPAATQDKIAAFRSILGKVKRASAQIDRIEIANPPQQTTAYLGGALLPAPQETRLPQHRPGLPLGRLWAACAAGAIVSIRLPPIETRESE